jgi:hypothetical protein
MNFKDLIDKYKSGTATKEENQIVETEIEKNEAITEYLAEQIMEVMPQINNGLPVMEDKSEASKIRKRINRKFSGAVIASVAAVIVIFCAVQFAVFPLINNSYYNPLDGRVNVIGVEERGQMSIDMSGFSELHLRGYETPFVFAKPEGLGKYDLTIYQYDSFRNYSETQYHSGIVRGKLNQSALGDAITRGLGFNWVQLAYGNYTDSEKIDIVDNASRVELTRLPESAQVKAYLFFGEAMDMQTLTEFVKESDAQVLWAGVKCSDNEMLWDGRFGFSPLGKYIPLTKNAYDAELYPLLELDGSEPSGGVNSIDFSKLNANAYETHFISMLKYMTAKGDFMDVIGLSYDYEKALSYVAQNGVMCHGVVVSGSRNDIEQLANDPMIQYIAIDDVMASMFSRQ